MYHQVGASQRVFQLLDRSPAMDWQGTVKPMGSPEGADVRFDHVWCETTHSSLPHVVMNSSISSTAVPTHATHTMKHVYHHACAHSQVCLPVPPLHPRAAGSVPPRSSWTEGGSRGGQRWREEHYCQPYGEILRSSAVCTGCNMSVLIHVPAV